MRKQRSRLLNQIYNEPRWARFYRSPMRLRIGQDTREPLRFKVPESLFNKYRRYFKLSSASRSSA